MPCVLGCVTNSPTAGRVVRASARCARAYGTELCFLHVGRLESAARERLEAIIEAEAGMAARLLDDAGTEAVEDVICRAAREAGASLLIMGALERESPLKDLVGSTARRVALRAGCSVLLVSTAGRDPSAWSRHLASISLADPSHEVAEAILTLARQAPTASAVCFATEREGAAFRGGYQTAHEFDVQGGAYAGLPTEEHALATFVSGFDTRGLDVSAIALSGRAGHEVARYAEEYGADVLGIKAPDRPLGFLDRFFSQPTVVVMDKLPCSLLLVRADGPAGLRRAKP